MMVRSALRSGVDLSLTSFLDRQPVAIDDVKAHVCAGSKAAFAARSYSAALATSHALYDSVGIAGAHPKIPGLRRPYAVFIHGIEVWEGLRADHRATIRNADLVLANSTFTLDRFQSLHGALSNAQVCALATEDEAEPPRAGFDGPPTVLIVGRIEASESYKGHRELIDCWPAVVAGAPGARLVIAGAGSGLAEVRAWAAASPASDAIEVLGFVAEEDLPAVWRRAHVLAMPSRGEGFGLVYVEAMRLGLPVVASTLDAGQEVNIDGETGFNVDLADPADLPRRLIQLLSDRTLAQRLGAQGQARWRELYRFSAFDRRFAPILLDFLAR